MVDWLPFKNGTPDGKYITIDKTNVWLFGLILLLLTGSMTIYMIYMNDGKLIDDCAPEIGPNLCEKANLGRSLWLFGVIASAAMLILGLVHKYRKNSA